MEVKRDHYHTRYKSFQITVYGDSGVGKRSILTWFVNDGSQDSEFYRNNHQKLMKIDDHLIELNFKIGRQYNKWVSIECCIVSQLL